jgi:hypothetical protein
MNKCQGRKNIANPEKKMGRPMLCLEIGSGSPVLVHTRVKKKSRRKESNLLNDVHPLTVFHRLFHEFTGK